MRIAAHATLRRTHWLEDPARVRLVFRSGRLTTIHEGPLGVYDGGLPAGFLPADAPAPALDAVHGAGAARDASRGDEED